MRISRIKRAIFKFKRKFRAKDQELKFDATQEVREVARLGQRLVVMELR